MRLLACVNGQIVPMEKATVSSFDFGFLYGVGLFETFRTWRGKLFALELHLARLLQSVQQLGWQLPFGADTLAEWVQETVNANAETGQHRHDFRLRLTVTPGVVDTKQGWWDWTTTHPTVTIHAIPLPPDFDERNAKGWTAVIAPWRRTKDFPLWKIKSANYFANLMARRYAKERDADEALWLNTEGHLTEGTATNFFLVCNGELWTPLVSEGLLPGIVRQIVVELAPTMNIVVHEAPLPLSKLNNADEAFVTNAVIGVVPLTRVERQMMPSRKIAQMLHKLFIAKAVGDWC